MSAARGRVWRWVAIGALAALVLLVLGVHHTIANLPALPVHIVVDGEPVLDGLDLGALDPWQRGALAAAVVLAALAVLIVVPLVVAVAVGAAFAAAALGVALPVLLAVAVAAVVFSPLILLGVGVWWLARRRRRGATMPA